MSFIVIKQHNALLGCLGDIPSDDYIDAEPEYEHAPMYRQKPIIKPRRNLVLEAIQEEIRELEARND